MQKKPSVLLIFLLIILSVILFLITSNAKNDAQSFEPIISETPVPNSTELDGSEEILPTAEPVVAEITAEVPGELTVGVPDEVTVESFDQSVLSDYQREILIKASQAMITQTGEESIGIARMLDYTDFPHPITISGPLAVGILRDAGLVNNYIDLNDFWLLNIRDDYAVLINLEKNFPSKDYFWYRDETALVDIDFLEFPLYSGDLLYLYADYTESFEQFLLVTRVNEEGRVYGVSAYLTNDDEYLIDELLLYDPNQPGEGYFYDIADPSLSKRTTGSGGFQLWRPTTKIAEPTYFKTKLAAELDRIFEAYPGSWHVLVKEVGGETFYSRQASDLIHPGSIVKVPTSFLIFKALEDVPEEELRDYLWTHYPLVEGEDRNFTQLLSAMLVHSQEAAAGPLIKWVLNSTDYYGNLAKMGVTWISIEPRYVTVNQLSFLFEEMYSGNLFNAESTKYLLELLSTYTKFDETFIGVITDDLPAGSTIYNKRGAIYNDPQLLGDIAIIETPMGSFLVTIFSYPEKETDPPYEVIQVGLEEASKVIWSYLSTTPSFIKNIDFDDQPLEINPSEK